VKRAWHVIDVSDKVLGRAASQIATLLKGKHKPIYTPSMDTGDHVIVINAEKVRVTGNKLEDKLYYRFSGYPGGLAEVTLRDQLATHPERVLERTQETVLGFGARHTEVAAHVGAVGRHVGVEQLHRQAVLFLQSIALVDVYLAGKEKLKRLETQLCRLAHPLRKRVLIEHHR
jgi:large subunit ribosomal protein L13